MSGETLPSGSSGSDEIYLQDTIIGMEGLSREALLAEIIKHIEIHLKELRAGSYDHIVPDGSVGELIDYNQRLLEDFSSDDVGSMSSQALIARYYACYNEEDDYIKNVRLKH